MELRYANGVIGTGLLELRCGEIKAELAPRAASEMPPLLGGGFLFLVRANLLVSENCFFQTLYPPASLGAFRMSPFGAHLNLLRISSDNPSILENANHLFPRSFNELLGDTIPFCLVLEIGRERFSKFGFQWLGIVHYAFRNLA